MVALLALAALCQTQMDVPARQSRAAFSHAMGEVQSDWTEAQVAQKLGPPDEIRPAGILVRMRDGSVGFGTGSTGDTVWCYGTDGPGTMPTLGLVTLAEGKVVGTIGGRGEPPSQDVIGEAELTRAMRGLYRSVQTWYPSDPLRLIQAANLLIPLGTEKAIAVLREYSRVSDDFFGSDWLFWLVRVVFTSKLPGGVFALPSIGAIDPPPPEDQSKWPTYPVVMTDDVPICMVRDLRKGESPESFGEYLAAHQGEWAVRRAKLRPPGDPFRSYWELLGSSDWPFRAVHPKKTGYKAAYDGNEGRALREVLTLVRTVYRPKEGKPTRWMDLDAYAKAFNAPGCRWDVGKQTYTREDGTALSDGVSDSRPCSYAFEGIPGLDVTVTFERMDAQKIAYRVKCLEPSSADIGNAVMIVRDADSDEEVEWLPVNAPDSEETGSDTQEGLLSKPPHTPHPLGKTIYTTLQLKAGARVRFVLLFGGQKHTSPEYSL